MPIGKGSLSRVATAMLSNPAPEVAATVSGDAKESTTLNAGKTAEATVRLKAEKKPSAKTAKVAAKKTAPIKAANCIQIGQPLPVHLL